MQRQRSLAAEKGSLTRKLRTDRQMKILILEDGTPASADLNAKLAELGIEVVGIIKAYPGLDALPAEAVSHAAPCSRILVPVHDKLLPIALTDVAFFYSTDRATQVCLKDGRTFGYSKSLDGIMSTLDNRHFYRANKQFIVAHDVIDELVIWFDSRLLLHLAVTPPEPIYVSKNKAAEFKQWMML